MLEDVLLLKAFPDVLCVLFARANHVAPLSSRGLKTQKENRAYLTHCTEYDRGRSLAHDLVTLELTEKLSKPQEESSSLSSAPIEKVPML